MIRPVQMRELSIVVPKEQLHNFLLFTGREQVLHLIRTPQKTVLDGTQQYDTTTLLARSSSIKNRLAVLTSILGSGEVRSERVEAPVQSLEALADFLDKETGKLEQASHQLEDSVGKLESEKERVSELARFLAGLANVGVSLDAIGGKGFLVILAGEVAQDSVRSFRRELDEVTYGNLVFVLTGSSGKTQTFLAVFPSAFQEEARQVAASLGAKLEPSWEGLPAEMGESRKFVDSRLAELDRSSKQLAKDRETLAEALGPKVRGLSLLSEVLEARARALSGSFTTQTTCVIQAYVPQDRIQQFTEGASRACNGLLSVHEEYNDHNSNRPAGHKLAEQNGVEERPNPPTLIRVPGWAKPLQSVVDNFGIPSYNETNPLIFMLVSFPLVYGLMFGDFGEGPIFILLGLFLWRLKKRGTKVWEIVQPFVNSAELMIMLGVGITVFGLVFGDFFGFESKKLFGENFPVLFSPTAGALENDIANLKRFMVIVLLFGVGHFTFGLSLSVYNKVRLKEYAEAFFGPVCWIWFYLTGVYLVAEFAQANFDFGIILNSPVLLVLLVVPIVLMGWKEGGLHAFEAVLSSASNTFSYLRIWALNIADFFFKFALFTSGGIPGAIGGNVLVMIIEGLIVFVQTLRLHWVEWFSKFYEGAGLSFAPYKEPIGWLVPTNG